MDWFLMSLNLSRKSILKKTFQVGVLTMMSKMLGVVREILQANFFGVGVVSDAFIMAFKIPNLFRNVFAEGALNASFVPIFIKVFKRNRSDANNLTGTTLFFSQGVILIFYLFVFFNTRFVVKLIAPGFSQDQMGNTIMFLRILFPYLFLVSATALFGGALNSVNHFFSTAISPAVWNVFYISSLLLALFFKLNPTFVCAGILFGGVMQLLLNLVLYWRYNFRVGIIGKTSLGDFGDILVRFFPCIMGVSIVEINFFVSSIIASLLPEGSVSLLHYSNRFMSIPVGVFAVAFSNILLPHFSRVVLYAPKRLSFYILEVSKLVTWVTIPSMCFLMFASKNIFFMMLSSKGTPEQILQAKWILIIYSSGLLFFCMNKVLLNIFYSFKDTRSTMVISGVSAVVNIICDLLLVFFYGIYGITFAAVISGFVMTSMALFYLRKKHGICFYACNYLTFLLYYILQLSLTCFVLFLAYYVIVYYFISESMMRSYLYGVSFWFIICPLFVLIFAGLFFTRSLFGIKSYFLGK
jgi:putative peptidoglycan lipid II flippase